MTETQETKLLPSHNLTRNEKAALWMFVAFAKGNAHRPDLIDAEADRMMLWLTSR